MPPGLTLQLLRIAYHHRVVESDAAAGLTRIVGLLGRPIEDGVFHAALGAALAEGLVHDPVRLPAGALQCHWHLELTPKGMQAVRAQPPA